MSLLERSHVGPSDAELISRVRGGDRAAYGDLFERHREAATRLARALTRGNDADDLVSEAFTKVFTVLLDGGGPDLSFRAYLLTSVRRIHIDRVRRAHRSLPTDDIETLDSGVAFEDPAIAGFEGSAAAQAYASLPERWQLVLWHLEVEGQKPADVAPLLGLSPNSVSALGYRAREGLRQAFLQLHAADIGDQGCKWTRGKLGAYVRSGLSRRDATKVERHLEECRPCTAVYLELTEVNSSLGAILGPLVLGSAAAAYLGGGSGGLALLSVLWGRARDLVTGNSQAAVVATTVAAAATVGVGGFLITQGSDTPATPTARQAPAPLTSQAPRPMPTKAASPRVRPKKTPPKPQAPRATTVRSPIVLAPVAPAPTKAPKPPKTDREEPPAKPPPTTTPTTPPPTTQPTAYDVALQLSVPEQGNVDNGATKSTVQLQLSGLPEAVTTKVTLALDVPVQSLELPPGCVSTDEITATCDLANGSFLIYVVHKTQVFLTARAEPLPGHPDPDLFNNEQTI